MQYHGSQFQSILTQQPLAGSKRPPNATQKPLSSIPPATLAPLPSGTSKTPTSETPTSSTPTINGGSSFVNKIRQQSNKSTPSSTPLLQSKEGFVPITVKGSGGSSSGSFSNILTQAGQQQTNGKDGAQGKGNSSSTPPLPSGQKWVVNEKRLAQWQAQPHNLSPATHLNLEPMLPPPSPEQRGKPLLVLDVDETLVHASFTPAKPYHVKITIQVDGETGDIFVAYRPHLFTFLDAILPLFEVAIFTASQACYADQLLDAIDPQGRLGRLRLFREHCTEVNGSRVKDLSLLGRPLHRIALIDNSPVTYLFQPRNAIPILSWFEDPRDTELLKLLPMLRLLAQANTVYDVLDLWNCSQR